MHTSTILDIEDRMAHIRTKRDEAARLVQDLSRQYETLASAREIMLGGWEDNVTNFPSVRDTQQSAVASETHTADADGFETPEESENQSRMNIDVDDLNFSGTRNMGERVLRIADATTDGVIFTTHVRDILIEFGISQATTENLRDSVQKFLDNSESFFKTEPGRYEYVHKTVEDDPET